MSMIRPYLENEEQKNVNIAGLSSEFQGPICDFEGFSQHKGECWNDTLQEIFLFTDGLKEITQPLIYNLDTSYDSLFKLVSSKLYPDSELNEAELNTVNKMVKYITLMKVRFVTHYNFLTAVRNTTKRPLLSKIYKSKRRYSTLCGVGSAKHAINLYHGNSNVYRPGLSPSLRNEVLMNLIRIFDVGYVVTQYKGSDKNINAFLISANVMKFKGDNIYKGDASHAFGFLKCDSVWRLYDDNRDSFIRINERLLSLFVDEDKIALGVDNNTIFIIKYVLDNTVASITEYYDIDENKWKEWNGLHKFKSIFIKSDISIVRPRVRWGNTRRGTIRGGKMRDGRMRDSKKKS
jgi:hypothetical protein